MANMLIVDLPVQPDVNVTLEPNAVMTRRLRGQGQEPPADALESLPGRLSLGGPVTRGISAESTDDAELRQFLTVDGAGYDFYLVRMSCTLRHDRERPFNSALVAFDLSAKGEVASAPIAWSMDPRRLFDPVEVSRTVSLGPSLKVSGIGLDATAGIGTQRERKDVFIEALYELESTPTWAMHRTASTQLRGVHTLNLVIRAQRGATTTGAVTASATVEQKRFGLIAYSATFPGNDKLSFELASSAS